MENKEQLIKEELTYEDVAPVICSHCGLDLDIHDGDGFCPGGTEEAGGRRWEN